MSELSLFLVRVGFLAILWIFVLVAFSIVRTDLFGQRASKVAVRATPRRPPPRRQPRGRKNANRLVVIQGPLAGTSLSLGESTVTIGRANDSTLVLTDDYASNRHARLTRSGGEWLVEDMGSTNGTYLDRTKVTQPTPVPPGVPIRIGKTVIELRR